MIEMLFQQGERLASRGFAKPEGCSNGRIDQLEFMYRSEWDVKDPIWKFFEKALADLQGETGLTYPTWSREGQQTHFRLKQFLAHQGDFGFSSNEGGELGRQVV